MGRERFIQFSDRRNWLKSHPLSLWRWISLVQINHWRNLETLNNFNKEKKNYYFQFVISRIISSYLRNFKVSIINIRGRRGARGKRSKTNIGPIEFPRGDTPFTPIRRGRCFSRDNLKATLHASFPSVLFHPASFLFRLHPPPPTPFFQPLSLQVLTPSPPLFQFQLFSFSFSPIFLFSFLSSFSFSLSFSLSLSDRHKTS